MIVVSRWRVGFGHVLHRLGWVKMGP